MSPPTIQRPRPQEEVVAIDRPKNHVSQCSKSHKLTRQNCRRMPHKILMKNTSSEGKKKKKIEKISLFS